MRRPLDFPEAVGVRELAVKLVTEKLPAREGNEWLEHEVFQERLHKRGHVPSPELAHWMLWKIGCRDSRILTRDVPELKIVWTPDGVRKIAAGAQRTESWVTWNFDMTPKPGDILHLGKPTRGEIEHVCIFLRTEADGAWTTADVLPCEKKGHVQATIVTRKLKDVRIIGQTGVEKHINGWLCLDRLRLDVAPESTP